MPVEPCEPYHSSHPTPCYDCKKRDERRHALEALILTNLNGDAEHDTDEDGCHVFSSHYRGRKGGQEEHCPGCRWERDARAALGGRD